MIRKHNVSETASVSILRGKRERERERERPTLLGPLEKS
jgi:hypothetical protein